MSGSVPISIDVTANTGAAKQALDELAGATRENKTAVDDVDKSQKGLAKTLAQTKARQAEATAAVRAAKEAQQEHNLTVQAFGPKSKEAAASAARMKTAQTEAARAAREANDALEANAKALTAVTREEGKASPATKRMQTQLERLGGDAERTAGELRRLDLQMAGMGRTASKEAKTIGGFLGTFAGNLAAGAVGHATELLKEGAGWVLETGARYETLKIALETTTGSAAKANVEFERLQAFAQKTPFGVEELTNAFIKLGARGINANDRLLTSLGNTASAMGKTLDDAVEAVADAITGENERMKEFGIVGKLAGDKVLYTFKGVTTSVSRDAASITEYITKIGEANFAGGMEKQSKTLAGLWSSLIDQAAALADSLMQGLSPALKELMGEFDLNSSSAKEAAKAFGKDLGEALRDTVTIAKALYEPLRQLYIAARDLSDIKDFGSGASFFNLSNWRSLIGVLEEADAAVRRQRMTIEQGEAAIRGYAVAHGGALTSQHLWIQNTLLSAEAQERVNNAVRIGLSLQEDKILSDRKNAKDLAESARLAEVMAKREEGIAKRYEYSQLSADKTLTPSQKKRKNELAKELDVPGDPKRKKHKKKKDPAFELVKKYNPNDGDKDIDSLLADYDAQAEAERVKGYERELELQDRKLAAIDQEMAALDQLNLREGERIDMVFYVLDVEGEAETRRAELQATRLQREEEMARWQLANAKTDAERELAQTRVADVESKKRLANRIRDAAEEKKLMAQKEAVFEKVTTHVNNLGGAMVDAAWEAAEGQKGAGLAALGDYLKTVSKQMAVKAMVETALGVAALAGIASAGLAPGHFIAAGLAASAAIAAGGAGIGLSKGAEAQAGAGKGRPAERAANDDPTAAAPPPPAAEALEAQEVPVSHEQGRRDMATERALAKEIHLHLVVNGNVIGEGGKRELGRYLQSVLDEDGKRDGRRVA